MARRTDVWRTQPSHHASVADPSPEAPHGRPAHCCPELPTPAAGNPELRCTLPRSQQAGPPPSEGSVRPQTLLPTPPSLTATEPLSGHPVSGAQGALTPVCLPGGAPCYSRHESSGAFVGCGSHGACRLPPSFPSSLRSGPAGGEGELVLGQEHGPAEISSFTAGWPWAWPGRLVSRGDFWGR